MPTRWLVSGAALLVAAGGGRALALPAPKTEAEMMQMSDLVVDAQCMSVICSGKPVEDAQKITTY